MTIVIIDDQIFDIRNFERDYEYYRQPTRKMALDRGYPYIAWNGSIVDAETDQEVFYPPAGFWIPSTLPFIGWKKGYAYQGVSLWLKCDKKTGFKVIPLRK